MNDILGWILILIGMWYSIKVFSNLKKAEKSEVWPIVEGMVIESYVSSYISVRGKVKSSMYTVEVNYRYTVDGIENTGNRYSFSDPGSPDKVWAETERGWYSAGKEVKVYYCPENPEESVLNPVWQTNIYLLFPLLIIIFGVILVGKN